MIEKEFVETGKVRYVLLDLPLAMHPLAFKAAEAAQCARDQGKYWEMHQRLFANQRNLEPWTAHAEAIGLDVGQFEACLSSDKHAEGVRQAIATARQVGATGTPSFVLAETDPDNPSRVTGVSFIRGAQPFNVFKAQIEDALREAGQ